MITKTFGTMTATERADNLAKAKTARAAKAAVRRASTLQRDWSDRTYHEHLASVLKLRLPPPGEALTPTVLRKFLNRIGWTADQYCDWSGEKTLRSAATAFVASNPGWSARQWAGCLLEQVARERGTVVAEPVPA